MTDHNKLPEIILTTLHAYAVRGNWRLGSARARQSHCLFWITRGQGRISVAGTTRGFAANTILFIPAGLVHHLDIGKLTQGYIVTMPVHLQVPVPEIPTRIRASSIFEQGQITGYFESIVSELHSAGPGHGRAIESYLTLLGIWLARNQNRNDWQDGRQNTAPARLVARFLQDLEHRLQKTPTVAGCAAALNVTPTHLSRTCSALLGKPASKVIHDRLILEAKFLLADSPASISEIATGLGFGSAAYFSRLFHQQTGQSPRAFRKSLQGHR